MKTKEQIEQACHLAITELDRHKDILHAIKKDPGKLPVQVEMLEITINGISNQVATFKWVLGEK